MTQQLIIQTSDRDSLRSLLESALDREKRLLQGSIERTRIRLAEFEQQFGLNSAEFERRLNSGDLEEFLPFTDWRMEMGMLMLLERKYKALEGSKIVD